MMASIKSAAKSKTKPKRKSNPIKSTLKETSQNVPQNTTKPKTDVSLPTISPEVLNKIAKIKEQQLNSQSKTKQEATNESLPQQQKRRPKRKLKTHVIIDTNKNLVKAQEILSAKNSASSAFARAPNVQLAVNVENGTKYAKSSREVMYQEIEKSDNRFAWLGKEDKDEDYVPLSLNSEGIGENGEVDEESRRRKAFFEKTRPVDAGDAFAMSANEFAERCLNGRDLKRVKYSDMYKLPKW